MPHPSPGGTPDCITDVDPNGGLHRDSDKAADVTGAVGAGVITAGASAVARAMTEAEIRAASARWCAAAASTGACAAAEIRPVT
ncbi:hypothetical protein ABT369_17015 [Dactylosporangium sp. NPDC000244]|uniref:hypothetical protein n=1 Tax=Dactylosporangium sp. NPDC000244 TaxID=3154365 RepID=UPI003327B94F